MKFNFSTNISILKVISVVNLGGLKGILLCLYI